MNLYWLRDKETQKYLRIHCEKGLGNGGDCFTKRYPTIHHRQQRKRYMRDTVPMLFSSLSSIYNKDHTYARV